MFLIAVLLIQLVSCDVCTQTHKKLMCRLHQQPSSCASAVLCGSCALMTTTIESALLNAHAPIGEIAYNEESSLYSADVR